MPGPNTTGLPNTADYNLGRGIVYFAELENSLPGAYRDLGNCTEFNISIEVETIEHQSSRQGLRVVDKEVVISQKMTLTLTLDELNHENLALWTSGAKATHTNVAVAGFTKYEMVESIELGRHFDIVNSSGERAYDVDLADLTLNNGTTDAALVSGTDFTLDEEFGTIFILSTATNITAGVPLDVTLAAKAGASAVNEVQGLKTSSVTGALKFVSENPANNDARTEYQFHQVALKPTGDFGLISDEYTQMQFEGAAEANATAGGSDSPTLTIRTVAAVT
jgi:hypothetical protein